jgi:hypothetical protein
MRPKRGVPGAEALLVGASAAKAFTLIHAAAFPFSGFFVELSHD